MEKLSNFTPENKEKAPRHYEELFVSPGYASKKHRSGLSGESRLRLRVAAFLFLMGRTDKIVVGGSMIHEMLVPFAELMKKDLKKLGIPEDAIKAEQDTYNTDSQIKHIQENYGNAKGNLGFITDSAQAMHVKALLPRYGLKEKLEILTIEDIVHELDEDKSELIAPLVKKLHESNYWKYWWTEREAIMTILAKCDPNGRMVKFFSELVRHPKKSEEK